MEQEREKNQSYNYRDRMQDKKTSDAKDAFGTLAQKGQKNNRKDRKDGSRNTPGMFGRRKGKTEITADNLPTSAQLKAEYDREKYRSTYARTVRSTVYGLLAVAAIAVLVATLLLPVLRIYGSSMTPTLNEGEIVISVKGSDFEQGDIVAFYYEGKILVKRVIATSGSWVDIDEEGNVYVDGVLLDEPYITDKALGECDIDLPYQVPDERIFVMGDHRSTSVDSRSSTIGCVAEEELVGRIVFRIWPLNVLGALG